MKDFQIDQESRGAVQIIRLAGSLDMYSFPRLESQLNALFQQGRFFLVLDCRDLDYIGSAGLGVVVLRNVLERRMAHREREMRRDRIVDERHRAAHGGVQGDGHGRGWRQAQLLLEVRR